MPRKSNLRCVIARFTEITCSRTYSTQSRRASSLSSFERRKGNLVDSAWEPVVGKNEEVVPLYYVERKRARDAIAERKEEEGDFMYELTAGILSDGLAASTRRQEAKIPTEHLHEDGRLLHASGFEVPTPGEAPKLRADNRDRNPLIQTAAVLERVQEESVLKDAVEAGFLDGNTTRQRGKIPYEVEEHDGTVRHPSGFVPPTPMTGFKREYHSSVGKRIV